MPGFQWTLLPAEIRNPILERISRQSYRGTAAAVCSEWQAYLEPRNFARLRLELRNLEQFGKMTARTAGFVSEIRVNVRLPRYSCPECRSSESMQHLLRNNFIFRVTLHKLFGVLRNWEPRESLTLELNVFSPSDAEHWFKHSCIELDDQLDDSESWHHLQRQAFSGWHEPEHGWVRGRRVESPSAGALLRVFGRVCCRVLSGLPESLPKTRAVTRLVVPRESLRRIPPEALMLLAHKLPRLRTIVYEPWSEVSRARENETDNELSYMISHSLPSHVETLSIFEDINFALASALSNDPWTPSQFNPPSYSHMVESLVLRSCSLKNLSISFMIDAWDFLGYLREDFGSQLRSLTLTAAILMRDSESGDIDSFLERASLFPRALEQLERLVLWNCEDGDACAVVYQRDRSTQKATLTTRATWNLALNGETLRSWKKVDPGYTLVVEHERLRMAIRRPVNAIRHLRLPGEILNPTSAWKRPREVSVEERSEEDSLLEVGIPDGWQRIEYFLGVALMLFVDFLRSNAFPYVWYQRWNGEI
ncbi:hypothetical protein ISF_06391 [Cordyceps fumosorosea ARSEF 2679]|uniref:DUF6546 domain-containing protein n=1 Tax=Cordyceps fumosorosea (strain ARSEF 2679) TaxID=1081104 RepID=A0A167SBL3_CORFA|nr:hypothetical protein ISF_06391 [Cordyceps fumosorosea ARSEF 2679]OAA59456.1 hypothetical protein ISF_06391 [Cordyceps fumosorosea ARSEF 2679]